MLVSSASKIRSTLSSIFEGEAFGKSIYSSSSSSSPSGSEHEAMLNATFLKKSVERFLSI